MQVFIRDAKGNGDVKFHGMGSWPWPHKSGDGRNASGAIHLSNISAAKRWNDDEGQHHLDLTTVDDLAKVDRNTPHTFKWLHVQTDKLDFDEFRTIALSTPGLEKDWRIVLLSLLRRVREVARTHDGNSWNTWVMRADSAELTMPKKYDVDLTAISVSFPYFALDVKSASHNASTHQFPGSGLFEWIMERNFEQLFPRMVDCAEVDEKFIYTAHVWCLVFDKSEMVSPALYGLRVADIGKP